MGKLTVISQSKHRRMTETAATDIQRLSSCLRLQKKYWFVTKNGQLQQIATPSAQTANLCYGKCSNSCLEQINNE